MGDDWTCQYRRRVQSAIEPLQEADRAVAITPILRYRLGNMPLRVVADGFLRSIPALDVGHSASLLAFLSVIQGLLQEYVNHIDPCPKLSLRKRIEQASSLSSLSVLALTRG
jgi:hypothetical protein